jgi:hypothetical protein
VEQCSMAGLCYDCDIFSASIRTESFLNSWNLTTVRRVFCVTNVIQWVVSTWMGKWIGDLKITIGIDRYCRLLSSKSSHKLT